MTALYAKTIADEANKKGSDIDAIYELIKLEAANGKYICKLERPTTSHEYKVLTTMGYNLKIYSECFIDYTLISWA